MSAEVYPSTDIIEPKETAVFRETLQILPFCFFYSWNFDTSFCKFVAISAKLSLAFDISDIDCTCVSTDALAC